MIVARSRTLAAAPEAVWRVVADPRALVRWWPRVGGRDCTMSSMSWAR